jgi:hypothetical protein
VTIVRFWLPVASYMLYRLTTYVSSRAMHLKGTPAEELSIDPLLFLATPEAAGISA